MTNPALDNALTIARWLAEDGCRVDFYRHFNGDGGVSGFVRDGSRVIRFWVRPLCDELDCGGAGCTNYEVTDAAYLAAHALREIGLYAADRIKHREVVEAIIRAVDEEQASTDATPMGHVESKVPFSLQRLPEVKEASEWD